MWSFYAGPIFFSSSLRRASTPRKSRPCPVLTTARSKLPIARDMGPSVTAPSRSLDGMRYLAHPPAPTAGNTLFFRRAPFLSSHSRPLRPCGKHVVRLIDAPPDFRIRLYPSLTSQSRDLVRRNLRKQGGTPIAAPFASQNPSGLAAPRSIHSLRIFRPRGPPSPRAPTFVAHGTWYDEGQFVLRGPIRFLRRQTHFPPPFWVGCRLF